jgi:hypothetical protein
MKRSVTTTVGLFLSLVAVNAMAGPGGFFQVTGQGMTAGAAKSNAVGNAAAVCAGQGKTLAYSEVIIVQQLGSMWRAKILAQCS